MSNFNFNEPIEKAAESIKRTTKCAEHGSAPTYELEKTSKGANVKWSFCCDGLKKQVEKKFKEETKRQIATAGAKAIADAFKKK